MTLLSFPNPVNDFAARVVATGVVLMAVVAVVLRQAWLTIPLLVLLVVPATLEAAFGYCVGCKIFAWGIRLGLVPEAVCEECADIWGPSALTRREPLRR